MGSACSRDPYGDVTLQQAAAFGLLARVEALLARPTLVDSRGRAIGVDGRADSEDASGATALIAAAMGGHADVVNALLAGGADVNKAERRGLTPLRWACMAHGVRSGVVAALLAAGADVNTADAMGVTPLWESARSGHVDEVKALVAAGADVGKATNGTIATTPLLAACERCYPDVVAALLAAPAGAEAAGLNVCGGVYLRSPLQEAIAASSNPRSVEVAQLLVAAGADVNKNDDREKSPPIVLAARRLDVEQGVPLLRLLVEAGAVLDVAVSGTTGKPPTCKMRRMRATVVVSDSN